jgi:hypothetical protein
MLSNNASLDVIDSSAAKPLGKQKAGAGRWSDVRIVERPSYTARSPSRVITAYVRVPVIVIGW